MTLVKFNPQNKKNSVLPGFNDIFESVMGDTFFADRQMNSLPAVNIHETNEAYLIALAAPGLKKEDFRVSVERDTLTISSEQSREKAAGEIVYNRKEFSYSSFTRAFTLPESADIDGIQANYSDGILNLTLPKKEEAKAVSRQIEIH
ncbi:Hsp20/alpha crystallin family protein [Pedobacter sp. Du54]|uniref:Hsp20/alpha crystallin family protein n=1 Tax=Pedobacter anseongensis TaxID=3133439 RepID=UPI0030A073B6